MTPLVPAVAATFAVLLGATAATAQLPAAPDTHAYGDSAYVVRARLDSLRRPYTDADVRFMSGMIAHHAQAVIMSRMAPTHDASPAVRVLAERIINAQQDEIALVQSWLRDREKPVPDPLHAPAGGTGGMAGMPGMEGMHHDPDLMPGMLTDAQLKELDAARGPAFDKLFLTDMIRHHNGAIAMVKDLFEQSGAGQDELVFKFANDVQVDQSTEVARMQRMLATILFGQ
jgi:uncharacterized protein (DUF305 family)